MEPDPVYEPKSGQINDELSSAHIPRFIRLNGLVAHSAANGNAALVAELLKLPAAPGVVGCGDGSTDNDGSSTNASDNEENDDMESRRFDASCVHPVGWLPGYNVFSLPPDFPLASLPSCQRGEIIGIDAASVATIAALNPRPGQSVLDICCAPGAKLALIAERMGLRGELAGVDVSLKRLGTACTLLRRQGVITASSGQPGWRCRLYCADGTQWADLTSDNAEGILSDKETNRAAGSIMNKSELVPVMDSLVENLFRRSWADGCRGIPPPFEPKEQVIQGTMKRILEGVTHPLEGLKSSNVDEVEKQILRMEAISTSRHLLTELCRQQQWVEDSSDESGRDGPRQKKNRKVDGWSGSSAEAAADGTIIDVPRAVAAVTAALSARLPALYDCVLVDAQCTHDGSLRHLEKAAAAAAASSSSLAEAGAAINDDGLSDASSADYSSGTGILPDASFYACTASSSSSSMPEMAASLRNLQRGLLLSGFQCLKPGGSLVYSTCSMEPAQNEEVVQWLLSTQPSAQLVRITWPWEEEEGAGFAANGCSGTSHSSGSSGGSSSNASSDTASSLLGYQAWQARHALPSTSPPCLPSAILPLTLRFAPGTSGTSGQFMAKLTKN